MEYPGRNRINSFYVTSQKCQDILFFYSNPPWMRSDRCEKGWEVPSPKPSIASIEVTFMDLHAL